jgi:hypothetical protein
VINFAYLQGEQREWKSYFDEILWDVQEIEIA